LKENAQIDCFYSVDPVNSCQFPFPIEASLFFSHILKNPMRLASLLLSVIVSLCASLLAGSQSNAQEANLRYELGKRVQRYERLWETSSPEARAVSTATMERAVQEFFRFDLTGAAKSLDAAWLSMQKEPSEFHRNAASLSVSAQPVINANPTKMQLYLKSIYPVSKADWLHSATLELALSPIPENNSTKRITKTVSLSAIANVTSQLPLLIEWELDKRDAGEYDLDAVVSQDGLQSPVVGTRVSVLPDKQTRIQAVTDWIDTNKRTAKTSSLCTARTLGRQLQLADRGKSSECDLPLESWLREFESIAFSLPEKRPMSPSGRWQVLTDGKVEQVVRMHVPVTPPEKPTLVFAFHGAGGSENMFFETYGAGRLIELARSRNWFVVCPRQSLTGLSLSAASMIPMLETEFDVSFNRVFFVGHSMGAAQAIEQVSKSQDRITAVAAISGGGNPQRTDSLEKIPFYVAAGERDFGKAGAKRLANTLQAFGCHVKYSEYADVEHLTIVQACLNELFTFLDQSK